MSSTAPHTAQEQVGGPGNRHLLELRGLTKSFGGVAALRDVDLAIRAGEVHGLLGENGSGKSTLIKVLAGFHAPDAGELSVNGEAVRLPLAPSQFRDLGLTFVHQDLGLLPELTVLENLLVGRNVHGTFRRIGWRGERRRAREIFRSYGVDLPPDAKVGELSALDRALLAIVRAAREMDDKLRDGGEGAARGVLVLDEPTVFLPASDTDRLFDLVRRIAASGSSVLFVSHDLDEVLQITDRVTVLRDGRVHGTVVTEETDAQSLIEMIVGRAVAHPGARADAPAETAAALAVEGLSGDVLRDVSMRIRRGEVLGITGLAGSGFEELPYLLYGAKKARSGALVIGDDRLAVASMTPARSLGHGVVLLPADRQRQSAIGGLSLADNLMMQVLRDYFAGGRLRRSRIMAAAREACSDFDIRPSDPSLPFSALSGGNQQKAVLAKWMQTEPDVLLLHEATQGVDIGARYQITERVRGLASGGMSVLWASSDYEQLATVCDRVIVLSRGRVASELTGDQVTKEQITQHAYLTAEGGTTPPAADDHHDGDPQ